MAERDQNEGSGQQPPIGRQDDNQRTGQAGAQTSQSGGSAPLNEGAEPDLGGDDDVGPGGYSPESGASDLGGGETGLGDVGGRDAPDQGDIERGTERSANRDSDIEGSSANADSDIEGSSA